MKRGSDFEVLSKRLVDGRASDKDLFELFLFLRFNCFGNRAVRDVGDFVSHNETRDKGDIFDDVQGLFHIMAFQFKFGLANATGTLFESNKEELSNGVLASIRGTPAEKVFQDTKLQKPLVLKTARRALKKVASFDGKHFVEQKELTKRELDVLNFYATTFNLKAQLSAENLVGELLVCLEKNKLLPKEQCVANDDLISRISVFVIEIMHLMQIELPDRSTTTLHLDSNPEGILSVGAAMQFPKEGVLGGLVYTVLPVFSTNCSIVDSCVGDLLTDMTPKGKNISEPIESDGNGKLQYRR